MTLSHTERYDIAAEQGLQKLMEGNQRFMQGEAHPQ
jgi:hypothetical protein